MNTLWKEEQMNLKSIEYFLAAAEEMNITRAAERLFISQQALSSHLKRLEEEYGVPLFERRPSPAPDHVRRADGVLRKADHPGGGQYEGSLFRYQQESQRNSEAGDFQAEGKNLFSGDLGFLPRLPSQYFHRADPWKQQYL